MHCWNVLSGTRARFNDSELLFTPLHFHKTIHLKITRFLRADPPPPIAVLNELHSCDGNRASSVGMCNILALAANLICIHYYKNCDSFFTILIDYNRYISLNARVHMNAVQNIDGKSELYEKVVASSGT